MVGVVAVFSSGCWLHVSFSCLLFCWCKVCTLGGGRHGSQCSVYNVRRVAAEPSAREISPQSQIDIFYLRINKYRRYSYLRVRPAADGEVCFAVPCGAAGNLASGLLAFAIGLPVRLVGGTNANDALHRVLSGQGSLRRRDTVRTVSPSMDIQVPYNLWRMIYFASGGDAAVVRTCYDQVSSEGGLTMPSGVLRALRRRVVTAAVSDQESLEAIKAVHARGGYTLDPHTAVAVAAGQLQGVRGEALLWAVQQEEEIQDGSDAGAASASPSSFSSSSSSSSLSSMPIVCMASAHPIKFADAVAQALGVSCAQALADMRAADADQPCVAHVAGLAEAARVGYGDQDQSTVVPAGCLAVLRRVEQASWTQQVQAIVDSLPAVRV